MDKACATHQAGWAFASLLVIGFILSGCSGGGGNSSASVDDNGDVTTYTVTASVSGEGGTVTPESQNVNAGSFATVTVIPETGFAVAGVTTDCGGGALSADTYTTVAITADCSIQVTFDAVYAVGGVVSGLDGGEVTLQLSGDGVSEEISVPNGDFAFAIPVVSGDYAVAVMAQPEGWACMVDPATVTVADADVTVAVDCIRQLVLSYGIKQLQFSWAGVAGADYYRLIEDADGDGPGEGVVVAETIDPMVTRDIALYYQPLNARYQVSACVDVNTTPADTTDDDCNAVTATVGLADNLIPAIGYVKGAGPVAAGGLFGGAAALSEDGSTLAVGVPGAAVVYVYSRDEAGTWSRQAHSFEGGANSAFGASLALSATGDVLAVGAPDEAGEGDVSGAGSVYIYAFDGTDWSEPERLVRTAPVANDGFGSAVALSADGLNLAVGAPGVDAAAGTVYLYTLDANWVAGPVFARTTPAAGDRFGSALAFNDSGRALAVGAPGGNGVDLFEKSSKDWSTIPTTYSGEDADGKFGDTLALAPNGKTLVVGAPDEDVVFAGEGGDITVSAAGSVYVFAKDNLGWTSVRITRPNPAENERFGAAVAYGDGTLPSLAAGAPGEDGNGARGIDGVGNGSASAGSGAVYVYTLDGSWEQQAYVKAANPDAGDGFGSAVALARDGNTLAVGAPGEDSVYSTLCALGMDTEDVAACANAQADASAPDAGAVYLY